MDDFTTFYMKKSARANLLDGAELGHGQSSQIANSFWGISLRSRMRYPAVSAVPVPIGNALGLPAIVFASDLTNAIINDDC
jgi:hypothetical protein